MSKSAVLDAPTDSGPQDSPADAGVDADALKGSTPTEPEWNVGDIMKLPEVRAAVAKMVAEELARVQVVDIPSKAIAAAPGDRFITESNNATPGSSEPLRHYRCDAAKSVKVAEYDMDKLEAYQSGEKELPLTKEGVEKSAMSISWKRGHWINWLNGHCYAYTDNQVRNIERLRTLPTKLGGMPGIYEDTGGTLYRCQLCQTLDPFATKDTWVSHMWATHHEHVS